MDIIQLEPKETFITGTDINRVQNGKYVRLDCMAFVVCHTGFCQADIDMEDHVLRSHSLMVLLPGRVIHLSEYSEEYTHTYLCFDKDIIEELCNRIDPNFFRFLKENPIFEISEEVEQKMNLLLDFIHNIYMDKENIFRDQIARNCIQGFLLNLYDKTHRAPGFGNSVGLSRPEEIFHRFIKLVRQHCFTQREVNFYAGELFITARYLSTVAHEISHQTAKQIIDKHVIIEIKILLKTTPLTLQEIAHRMNFPDQSFFGRYFKKHTGLSPLQYRNKG
jgi:AraC-like DNA-binding protein